MLRDVREAGDTVEVTITPTYSGCPAMDLIALDVGVALDRAGIPHARLVILPRASHFAMLQAPDAFDAAVLRAIGG